MESVQSANVDSAKFLALDESKATTLNTKWKCCDFTLKMLEEGVHADITFNAKGGSVKAHKSVLACVSPVFNAMFQRMKEQLTSIVDIPDISIEALQLFLLLLYTTNEVDDEVVVAGSQQITHSNSVIDRAVIDKYFSTIHEAVLKYQMPPFSAAIDKHFGEFYKAVLKYQVERRLGCVLIGLWRGI